MKKSGQMIEFEEETGKSAIVTVKIGFAELQFPSEVYVQWLESELLIDSVKATAYDRLTSGGKKTPKEVANFLGHPIAMDAYTSSEDNQKGDWCCFKYVPTIDRVEEIWSNNKRGWFARLPHGLIEYTGDWEKSLTLPDGWEEK